MVCSKSQQQSISKMNCMNQIPTKVSANEMHDLNPNKESDSKCLENKKKHISIVASRCSDMQTSLLAPPTFLRALLMFRFKLLSAQGLPRRKFETGSIKKAIRSSGPQLIQRDRIIAHRLLRAGDVVREVESITGSIAWHKRTAARHTRFNLNSISNELQCEFFINIFNPVHNDLNIELIIMINRLNR